MKVKIDEISKKVAENNNEKEAVIRDINRSQWRLLHQVMQEGDLRPVKIMYLGKFSKQKKRVGRKDKGNI